MFVIKINNIVSSEHSQEIDALAQKDRFIAAGIAADTIQIVEQDGYNPPN